MVSPEITENGELTVEGHIIGTIEGFRFTLAKAEGEADSKNLRSTASSVVAPEIAKRADRLAGAPNEEFVLATDGVVRWRGEVVGELAEGPTLYAPRIIILADESLTGPDLEKVEDRLSLWLRHHINTQLEQLIALQEPADLDGTARGIAFQLAENLGILPRPAIAEEVKSLDQDTRGKLRKLGVKFGAHHIYLPMSLKPAPRELALILWGLKNGGVRQPGIAELPHIILSGRTSFPIDKSFDQRLYEVAGFKVAGERIVRVDILERLADIIRPLVAYDANRPVDTPPPEGAAEANGFRVTVEMTSLLGCAGDDFASILKSLGYRLRRTPKAATENPSQDPVAETEVAEAALDGAPVEAVAQVASEDSGAVVAATTTADAEPVPAEQAGEPEAPAEPEYDEVWFPAGRRPERNRNPRKPDGHQGKKDGHRAKGKGKQGSGPGPKGPRNDRPRPERREKPIDPDSPFAALAALKRN